MNTFLNRNILNKELEEGNSYKRSLQKKLNIVFDIEDTLSKVNIIEGLNTEGMSSQIYDFNTLDNSYSSIDSLQKVKLKFGNYLDSTLHRYFENLDKCVSPSIPYYLCEGVQVGHIHTFIKEKESCELGEDIVEYFQNYKETRDIQYLLMIKEAVEKQKQLYIKSIAKINRHNKPIQTKISLLNKTQLFKRYRFLLRSNLKKMYDNSDGENDNNNSVKGMSLCYLHKLNLNKNEKRNPRIYCSTYR